MEEYKNNSKKSKSEETKTIEKVISGTAKTKKKNDVRKFADVFISDIFMDILVPDIKKAISDIVINGIDMILYGEAGHTKKSNGTKPSYRSYYDHERNNDIRKTTRRTAYSFDDIVMDNRADAEEVLDSMLATIDKYGIVSVADMYDLVGITGNYTDNKYGWTDLRSARIERERDGGYTINLPRALPL